MDGVTVKSLFKMAYDHGWEGPNHHHATGGTFDFDSTISLTDDDNSTDTPALTLPAEVTATPSEQIAQYINAVFEPDDLVNVVIRTYTDEDGNPDGPDRGMYLKARDVVERMELIDTDPEVGAWICVNPLDSSGHRKNSAVTNCRVGVFESDTDDPEEFRRITRELGLPVVAEVDSGNKSVHELIRLDASDLREFRDRWNMVSDLYAEHGMTVDPKCKNPARLTRLPGVKRGERMQTLLATNFGASSWHEFAHAHEKPLLPPWDGVRIDEEITADAELVEGILRYGEVGLITARAKRGKSWLMLQLAVCIATGKPFLGHGCREGRVLYIDPELKPKTARKRLQLVSEALSADPATVNDRVRLWSLRGALTRENKVADIEAIAHDVELRAEHFDLVVLDSCSAFLGEGADENDNASIRRFITGHVARIAKATGGAVMMVHHEGKGATGDRTSEDRARGAGAWVDCPDLVIGLTAIYPPDGSDPETILGPNAKARRIECVAIRDNAEFETINTLFIHPLYRVGYGCGLENWRVMTSASLGGQAAGAIAKAKAADRATECCDILLAAHGDKWQGIISASEAAELVSRTLGETVTIPTLKKYIGESSSLGIVQTSPRRWSIENLTN